MSNIAILDWKFCDDWLIKTVMSNSIPDFETNLNFGLVTCAIRPDFHSHLLLKYLIVFKSTVNRSFFKLFFRRDYALCHFLKWKKFTFHWNVSKLSHFQLWAKKTTVFQSHNLHVMYLQWISLKIQAEIHLN